ncbi:MAG: hypothetical protein ACTSPB_01475 [Candidatus Thorarchaeota archaeon]
MMNNWEELIANKPFSLESLVCDEVGNDVETEHEKWVKKIISEGDKMHSLLEKIIDIVDKWKPLDYSICASFQSLEDIHSLLENYR